MESFVWKSLIIWIIQAFFANADSDFVGIPPTDDFSAARDNDFPEIIHLDQNFNSSTVMLAAVGGQRAYIKEFQHMAAIGSTLNGKITYFCGGTLITPKFVLTAAHCAKSKVPDTVRVGDSHLGSSEDDEYAQQIKIRTFKRHPNHRFQKSYFDIALIELESEAKIAEGVCPACLWLEKDLPLSPMQAIGFGATEFVDFSPTLQKVSLSAIEKKQCEDRFPSSLRELSDGIQADQFCAGSASMDTCNGDSGGPIQVEMIDTNGNQVPLIVGIVSFGTPFCSSGSFGVYTRVAPYREWIESETKTSMDYLTCTSASKCYNNNNDNNDRIVFPGNNNGDNSQDNQNEGSIPPNRNDQFISPEIPNMDIWQPNQSPPLDTDNQLVFREGIDKPDVNNSERKEPTPSPLPEVNDQPNLPARIDTSGAQPQPPAVNVIPKFINAPRVYYRGWWQSPRRISSHRNVQVSTAGFGGNYQYQFAGK